MKKVLAVLGLVAILGITTPVMAAPSHGGMHGGMGVHGGAVHTVHRGHPAPPPRHYVRPHSGITIYGSYPRHGYRYGYRSCYWNDPWCDYRLGWYDGVYCRPYVPVGGIGVNIRF